MEFRIDVLGLALLEHVKAIDQLRQLFIVTMFGEPAAKNSGCLEQMPVVEVV